MIVTTIHREISDLALELTLDIPTDWLEFEVPGPVLAFGGPLEAKAETLRPSVQVDLDPAHDAAVAFDIMREAVRGLPESEIVLDEADFSDGNPVLQLGWCYRNPETHGMQVQVVLTVFLPNPGLLLRVTGTCGGAASEDAVQRLAQIVNSVTISPAPRADA
jgi:hypothetical protein